MKPYYKYSFSHFSIIQTPTLLGTYDNYVYMIVQEDKAWVFDPGELKPIEKTLKENNLNLEAILLTHHHHDHIGATEKLKQIWNCPIYGHEIDQHRLPALDHTFKEGDSIQLGSMSAEVLFYPGHTLGLIAFYLKKEGLLFSNDLIFSLGCGRVFEGTPKQMYESLNKLSQLPDETLLMISHEYTKANLDFGRHLFPNDKALIEAEKTILKKLDSNTPTVPTTLGFEKKHSPFLRWEDNEIRDSLNMKNSKNWQVFAEIRARKDIY